MIIGDGILERMSWFQKGGTNNHHVFQTNVVKTKCWLVICNNWNANINLGLTLQRVFDHFKQPAIKTEGGRGVI